MTYDDCVGVKHTSVIVAQTPMRRAVSSIEATMTEIEND